MKGKHLLDRAVALAALVGVMPVLLVCALVIRVTSGVPILYRARRVGRGGREFVMFKLRTMRVGSSDGERISAGDDARVMSPFAGWLRRSKLDEVPQLFNVLRGEMAIVGPRPEDPDVVRRWYRPEHLPLLQVLPGLVSLGSLYSSTHGERLLSMTDTERSYVQRLLPVTLALDLHYVRHASLAYDARIVARTLFVVVSKALGRQTFRDPPELAVVLSDAAVLRPAV